MKLMPKGEARRCSQQELRACSGAIWRALPGVTIAVLEAGGFGGAEQPIQIYVKGDQIDELRRISDEVLAVVRPHARARSRRESGLEEERPEVRIDLRRDLASEMGIGIGALAGTLRPALAGQKVSTWEDPGGRAARRHRAAAEGGPRVGRPARGAAARGRRRRSR